MECNPIVFLMQLEADFFVITFTMLTRQNKQPALGTVTTVSHSLRIMRPLYDLQSGTKFYRQLKVARNRQ